MATLAADVAGNGRLEARVGIFLSILLHVALAWAAGLVPKEKEEDELELYEVAVDPEPPKPKAPPPPPPPPPEPEPEEPEPPEEPPPEEELKEPPPPPPDKPPPRRRTPKPPTPPVDSKPASAPAAKPIRVTLPGDRLVPAGTGAAVQVNVGSQVQSGNVVGSPKGKAKGKAKGTDTGTGTSTAPPKPAGKPWNPRSDYYIRKLPTVVSVPELQCPAVTERGISGLVVLKVQVRADGSVRNVSISKGIGNGCDKIAKKALRKAKFKPAKSTDGKSTDYELRYEYEFQAAR